MNDCRNGKKSWEKSTSTTFCRGPPGCDKLHVRGEHAPETERLPRNPVLDRIPTPFPILMDGNRSELGGEIDRHQSNGERMEESEKIDKKSI